MQARFAKPNANEFPAYFEGYISQLKDDSDPIEQMESNISNMQALINGLTDEQLEYRYAPDKWTIKELLQHIIDAERVFCYRAQGIARNDKTNFPGFDHDAYVPESRANARSGESLLAEYKAIRHATLHMFRSFDQDMIQHIGQAGGNPLSPKALAYVIPGHEMHHLNIINERYL